MRLQALGQQRALVGRAASGPLLLYDARCSVCRRFVSLVINADRSGTISIAPLLGQHGDAVRRDYPAFGARDSAIWIPQDGPALAQADAILAALEHVGGTWGWLAAMGKMVPRSLRNAAYRWFAGHRRYFAGLGLREFEPRVQSRTLPDSRLEDAYDHRR